MKKYEKFDKEIIKLSKEGKRPCEISKIIKMFIKKNYNINSYYKYFTI